MMTDYGKEFANLPSSKRGFSSSFGFIVSCVGSAVGLGNIWMFPYRLGQYGGAAFLIPYFLFIFLFGWVGLSAEFAVGRLARTGTLGAYRCCFASIDKKHGGRVGEILGWIPLLGSLGIAIGYAVILGWVFRACWGSVTGEMLRTDAQTYFSQATGEFGSVPWHILVVVLVCAVVFTGVSKGIEKVSKVLMPLFFVLFLLVAVWVAFLPGASAGYEFLFVPKWEALLKADTWVMAMRQAFFSLSITGSGMIVYGAYLDKSVNTPAASLRTALFDTLAAILSALAIMPAVFAFNIAPTSGPSLLFITLPGIFREIPFGRVFAVFFFISVAFAGITSLINMFEAVIESWQNRFHMRRKIAVALCGVITLVVGIFLEAEPKVGSWLDFVSIVVVPIGAVLGAISIYYILGYRRIRQELEEGRDRPLSHAFGFAARFLYVPLTILVLILGFCYRGIG